MTPNANSHPDPAPHPNDKLSIVIHMLVCAHDTLLCALLSVSRAPPSKRAQLRQSSEFGPRHADLMLTPSDPRSLVLDNLGIIASNCAP